MLTSDPVDGAAPSPQVLPPAQNAAERPERQLMGEFLPHAPGQDDWLECIDSAGSPQFALG